VIRRSLDVDAVPAENVEPLQSAEPVPAHTDVIALNAIVIRSADQTHSPNDVPGIGGTSADRVVTGIGHENGRKRKNLNSRRISADNVSFDHIVTATLHSYSILHSIDDETADRAVAAGKC